MGKKLIFFDIDGTIVKPLSHVPSEKVMEAVRELQSNGHKAFLCTGRSISTTRPLLNLGFNGSVSSAGTYIINDGEAIVDDPLTNTQRDRLVKLLHDNNMSLILCTENGDFADPGAMEPANDPDYIDKEQCKDRIVFRHMSEYDGSPVYTVAFFAPKSCSLDPITKKLSDEFTNCVYDVSKDGIVNGEFFKIGFDKGSGIKRLCEYLNVPLSDTIGFGDSMNDYKMMSTVGTSVCMGNGCDELKRISSMVCPSFEEDGVTEGLRLLGVIN